MPRFFAFLLVLAAGCLSAGCNTVLVDEPFGAALAEHHTAAFVGTYRTDQGFISVRQTGPLSLQAAALDVNERDGFRMVVADLEVRYWAGGGKKVLFGRMNYEASSIDADADEDPDMLKRWWFMYLVAGNAGANPPSPLVFAQPDRGAFRELVNTGELPGKMIGEHVLLGDATEEMAERLRGNGRGAEKLFRFDKPIVFERIDGPKR